MRGGTRGKFWVLGWRTELCSVHTACAKLLLGELTVVAK